MSLHEARMKSLRDEHEEKDKLEAAVLDAKVIEKPARKVGAVRKARAIKKN